MVHVFDFVAIIVGCSLEGATNMLHMGFHGGLWGRENDCIIRILMMRLFLWVIVGPMLGNLGSKLGPCWVIWWAMWGSMEVSRMKNSTPTENFSVEVHFGGT